MTGRTQDDRSLEVHEKRALETDKEPTLEGQFYRPPTDIYETADALTVVMEVPGVDRDDIDVRIDNNQLTVTARIGLERYGRMRPVYTEYDIGHFMRSFQLSSVVDQGRIEAHVKDGVLSLILPKVKEATPRRITVG